jgi:prolipoprotein diacylglyceryl transferase
MFAMLWGAIPSPSSGVLHIGPLDLRAYGLMIALGVVAAVWLFGRRLEESGAGTRDDASAIALWAVPAGVIGARLYHVATDWGRFSDHPADIIKIWKGGLGIPGGIALGVAVGLWATYRRGLRLSAALDAAAPAIPLAQAIGRWGNWFNQELYGKPTTLPWALKIDDAHLPKDTAGQYLYPPGTTFHPTFLYESLWNLALAGLLIWVGKRFKLRPGRLIAFYLLGYGVGRFWVEGLRIDPAHEGGGLRLNQWMALAVIAGSLIFFTVDWARHRNDPEVEEPDPFDELDDDDEAEADRDDDRAAGDEGVDDEEVDTTDVDASDLDDDELDAADLDDDLAVVDLAGVDPSGSDDSEAAEVDPASDDPPLEPDGKGPSN